MPLLGDTWGMRELAIEDPDANVLRIGSPRNHPQRPVDHRK
jgi:hypothetical protein